jgi:hypothetical protein
VMRKVMARRSSFRTRGSASTRRSAPSSWKSAARSSIFAPKGPRANRRI